MTEKKGHEDPLQFAALVAHQLRSPVGAAASLLKTILGEYAGQLNSKQKDLVARADHRIEEALAAVTRMLAIVRPEASGSFSDAATEAAAVMRRVQQQAMEDARSRNIALAVNIWTEPAYIRIAESGLAG